MNARMSVCSMARGETAWPTRRLAFALLVTLVAALCFAATTTAAPLPDGRAYEQASPVDKNGGNAVPWNTALRAAAGGGGINFLNSTGIPGADGFQSFNEYLSLRGASDWSTRGLLPPAALGAYGNNFGLSDDLAYSFPVSRPTRFEGPYTVYLRESATGALTPIAAFPRTRFNYVAAAAGAAAVVIESEDKLAGTNAVDKKENVYVWNRADGTVRLASVLNDGLTPTFAGAFAGAFAAYNGTENGGASQGFLSQDFHVLSQDGKYLLFTAGGSGQLYLRINSTQPQSALAGEISEADGAAAGLGDLTAGSSEVTGVVAARALNARTVSGSLEVTKVKPTVGRFVVGQQLEPVAGKIAAGTTVTGVQEVKAGEFILTLSQPAESSATNVALVAPGPSPFAVGQTISGVGIPYGTKVTGVGVGTLTLSAPASSAGSAVSLIGSTECAEPARACTVRVSASERTTPDPAGDQPTQLAGATPNGSAIFFTSAAKLTDDATTIVGGGADLYRYRPAAPAGERLTDLSVDANPADPAGAEVKGVIGYSGDGSYVYFVAGGRIPASGAPAASPGCTLTAEGGSGLCNVYLWHENPNGGATVSYVTQVEASERLDRSQFGETGGHTDNVPKARVADDGTLLVTSARPLTDYDNIGPCGGTPTAPTSGPCPEIYIYRPSDRQLHCVSCAPAGLSPLGRPSLQEAITLSKTTVQPMLSRNLSSDGTRAFFATPDPLAAADTNAQGGCAHVPSQKWTMSCNDVYEWEAPGAGTCTAASPDYSGAAGGCVYLLSAGTSLQPSYFGDASSNGNDVFIFTTSRLVSQDKDDLSDAYDVRVGGGLTSQNPVGSVPCEGEACRALAVPSPVSNVPGSVSVTGGENVPHQKQGQRKKRHHKKHKRHHRKKHHQRTKQNTQRKGRGR